MCAGKRLCCGVLSVLSVLAVPLPQKLAVMEIKTVEYVQAVREEQQLTAACDGELCCEEKSELYLTEPVYVEELLVSVGGMVTEGDVLLTVDSTLTEAVNGSSSAQKEAADVLALMEGVSGEEMAEWLKQYGAAESTEEKTVQSTAQIQQVTSPFTGQITRLNAGKNRMCGHEGPIAVIEDPDSIYARLYIGEHYADELREGAAVTLHGGALGEGCVLSGTVRKIWPEVQKRLKGSSAERVVCFEAALEKGEKLVSGSSVEGKVYLGEVYSCIVLPYECIRQDEAGEYVFVLREGKAEKRYITVEREFSRGAQVTGAIEEGDPVILCPDDLTDGMAVNGVRREDASAAEA